MSQITVSKHLNSKIIYINDKFNNTSGYNKNYKTFKFFKST